MKRRVASRDRMPQPTPRAYVFAATGVVLLLFGILGATPRVAILGVATLVTLLYAYVRFSQTAAVIWRRHVELSVSRKDPALTAGRAFRLGVHLRCRVPVSLGRVSMQALSSSALTLHFEDQPAEMGTDRLDLEAHASAERAGRWFLHGIVATFSDTHSLFALPVYFPSTLELEILPRRGAALVTGRSSAGAAHEHVGPLAARRRDLQGELRELRDHVPGDPFRIIAWKASARTGRLIVREHDRENLLTHVVLLDISGSMRAVDAHGHARIDRAIETAVAYMDDAFHQGDRVGLITFSDRVYAVEPPSSSPAQRTRLLDRMLDIPTLADEDLTDVTDPELAAGVARYLLHQRGIDSRVADAPPIDHPRWNHLLVAPTGALLDSRVLEDAIAEVLSSARPDVPAISATTPESVALRRYCRRRGIELPVRKLQSPEVRAHGLEAALTTALKGRGADRVVMLSDLEGLEGDLSRIGAVVARARRRRQQISCAQVRGAATPSAKVHADARARAQALGIEVVLCG